jgi:CheY-like chemotaxis protein
VERGKIPPIKIGGTFKIKKYSLDQAIFRQNKESRPTVLAVDDDPDVQGLFRIFLKKIGFRGVVVATAKADITSLRKQKFYLMFVDLQLPEAPRDQIYESAMQIDPRPQSHCYYRSSGQRGPQTDSLKSVRSRF